MIISAEFSLHDNRAGQLHTTRLRKKEGEGIALGLWLHRPLLSRKPLESWPLGGTASPMIARHQP